MKKIIIVAVAAMLMAGTGWADLSWAYSGNLLSWDATIQAGWLVQMYQDVNGDTAVNNITDLYSNMVKGSPTGGNSTDDVLLGGFTASLLTNAKDGFIQWGVEIPAANWATLYGQKVYSVIYNANTISGASSGVVVDVSSTLLGSADPFLYKQSSVNNNWVAVPEPATFMLVVLGGGLSWIIRRMRMS